jgi:heme/copper-type cytochrome/quinol oxidase subunit 1
MYTDYMRESVQELRHREILSFLIMVMGMISLMGGLTMTSILARQISWFLILPYEATSSPSSLLGIALTLLGFGLTSVGFVLAVYYDREKMWFLKHLKRSNILVDKILKKGKKKY